MDFKIKLLAVRSKIYRFAISILNNCDDAEDVAQDICEKMWRDRSNLEHVANLDGFAMRSTRNLCYDKMRHKKIEDSFVSHLREQEFLEEYVDTAEIITEIIKTLPPKQQEVIHLRDVECLELEVIADILEMEVSTVRANLSRARKTVREKYIKTVNYGL